MLVVNYFGIPTVGSISFLAAKGFYPLRKYGTQRWDCAVTGYDFSRWSNLAQVGSDHLRLNDHMDIAGVALAVTVINWLESQP